MLFFSGTGRQIALSSSRAPCRRLYPEHEASDPKPGQEKDKALVQRTAEAATLQAAFILGFCFALDSGRGGALGRLRTLGL